MDVKRLRRQGSTRTIALLNLNNYHLTIDQPVKVCFEFLWRETRAAPTERVASSFPNAARAFGDLFKTIILVKQVKQIVSHMMTALVSPVPPHQSDLLDH